MQPIEKNLRPRRCEREANEYAALLWMAAGGEKKQPVKTILTGSFQIETRVKQTEGGGRGCRTLTALLSFP